MSPTFRAAARSGAARRHTRLLALVVLVVSAHGFLAATASAQDSLSFFKNYFVTGDYVVRGVSLWRKGVKGKATVDLPKLGGADGVPAASDIVAAFLYVQTAERVQGSGIDRAKFAGNDFGPFVAPGSTIPGSGTLAKALNWDAATTPCWSVNFPGGRRLVTYRADVLRFLPIDPLTGKQALNTTLRLVIPDSGIDFGDDDEGGYERQDRNGPRAIGASLVVVYRDPTKPFKAIVMYDGGTTKRAFQTYNQTIKGFYDASTGTPVPRSASMTHIVGDGRPFLFEQVKVDGQLVQINPFRSLSGPKWDNWRTSISIPGHADSLAIRVEPLSLASDCLSWSAIVVATNVQDTDTDGLLDKWETQSGLTDPNGEPLPDLASMGAHPDTKDVFVEIGYLTANPGTTYGGVEKPAHSHLPDESALTLVGDAFRNAPAILPDGRPGPGRTDLHFDVGDNYQGSLNPYIIPASLAHGGKHISETMFCPGPTEGTLVECTVNPDGTGGQGPIPGQFPLYPGTIGWKTGFRFLRDEILGFDRNRKDMFRYALFAHSVGIPKESCLDSQELPDLTCQLTNPDFGVPRTYSGIGDFPGGDLLVALGAFLNEHGLPIGTPFQQGGTLMHELGHTYEFTHSGIQKYGVPREPNCKSNYLSVMNYLFQFGLPDAAGQPMLDFSAETNAGINELGLRDGSPLGTLRFQTSFYAPRNTSYLKNLGVAALKHCDGSDLSVDELNDANSGGGVVRVLSNTLLGSQIDWNANGLLGSTAFTQDINFDGLIAGAVPNPALKPGANDWANLRLNQLGSRRSVGGLYIDALGRRNMGPFSLDVGRGDIGRGDIGRGDIGRGDIGRGDIGRGDIGRGDIGRGDIGRGDIGRGDIGRGAFGGGDMDVGSANEPGGEIDFETATLALGNAPAGGLAVCRGNSDGCTETFSGRLRLTWTRPTVGSVEHYDIYRVVGATVTANDETQPKVLVGQNFGDGPSSPPATVFVDPSEGSVAYGTTYTYFVITVFADGSRSVSNFATITTPPPPIGH